MPQAGQIIRALDFPPTVYARQADPIAHTSSSLVPTSPACGAAFMAPTSGRVLITFAVRWDPAAAADRMEADVEVREGSAAGAVVRGASTNYDGSIDIESATSGANLHDNQPGWAWVEGLTPGAVYYAQVCINTDSKAFDIEDQSLVVQPAT